MNFRHTIGSFSSTLLMVKDGNHCSYLITGYGPIFQKLSIVINAD